MKGLLYKEGVMLKMTMRMQLFSLVIFAIMGFVLKNISYLAMMFTILSSSLCLNSLNYDAADEWNIYAATFPVRRESLISIKFILQYLLVAGSALFALVLGLPLSRYAGVDYVECAATVMACGVFSLLAGSLNLLLCTKFGVEKARVVLVLTYLVPFGLIMLLYYVSVEKELVDLSHVTEEQIYLFLAVVALSLLCWRLACRIFKKQER